jgi:hypothetical protein
MKKNVVKPGTTLTKASGYAIGFPKAGRDQSIERRRLET